MRTWFAAALIVLGPSMGFAQWSGINFVDEFGEVTDRGARSATVEAVRTMSFPYQNTRATLFVNCNRAWMRFTDTPNLTGGDISDGYTRHMVRVRVDGRNATNWRVSQSWGDSDVRFINGQQAVSALAAGSTIDIALPWYGERSAVFSWSLSGSSAAIRESCD